MNDILELINRSSCDFNSKLTQEKERVSKLVLNHVGYPNNVEWSIYQDNKYSLVDIVTGIEYASVTFDWDEKNCHMHILTSMHPDIATLVDGIGR